MIRRTLGLVAVAIFGLTATTATTATQPAAARHLEYQFGYNTKAAGSGDGTGTTTVEIAPAKDGGVLVTASDFWWHTARPRGKNTCEVYPNGTVMCNEAPHSISPIQLTLFPLLARDYFHGLSAQSESKWQNTFQIKAAIVAGAASNFGHHPYVWNCVYDLHGKGAIPSGEGVVHIVGQGTTQQEGGRYRKGTAKLSVGYDPAIHLPVIVDDVRTHLPQTTVYNNDWVELKLLKHSN